MNLTFGFQGVGFHCSTFPENNDGVIMTTKDLSFFIYCNAGSNDNTCDEYELKLRHFDRHYNHDYNDEYAYTTSNEVQVIDLRNENESQSTRFYFHLDDKVTSERRGFKMRAVPEHNNYGYDIFINDTISLDIITFHGDQTSTKVH